MGSPLDGDQSTWTQRRSHFSRNKCRCPPLLERQLPKTKGIFQVIKSRPCNAILWSARSPSFSAPNAKKKFFFFFVVTISQFLFYILERKLTVPHGVSVVEGGLWKLIVVPTAMGALRLKRGTTYVCCHHHSDHFHRISFSNTALHGQSEEGERRCCKDTDSFCLLHTLWSYPSLHFLLLWS